MKNDFRRLCWPALAAAGVLALGAADAPAQRPTGVHKTEFSVKRLEVRFVNPPAQSGGERGSREAGQVPWARLECEFDSQPEWADDVEIRWYVVLLAKQTKVMATGSDTYIYVKKGRRHVAGMFMHPFVVERWCGNSAQNAVEDVGVEIWWQGRLVSFSSWRSQTKTQWWQQFQPTPNLLMRVSESPWGPGAYAEYEWSKFTTAAGRGGQ
ncbi:MAG: hypothetical protein HZA91_01785 [Verrucomicrobia bacterium]|nr:hypothetical protein [Verrucomicrobiota bacterium]